MSDNTTSTQVFTVLRQDLPGHCPPPDTHLWNAHPLVYLPLEKLGSARCPYCGNQFQLVD